MGLLLLRIAGLLVALTPALAAADEDAAATVLAPGERAAVARFEGLSGTVCVEARALDGAPMVVDWFVGADGAPEDAASAGSGARFCRWIEGGVFALQAQARAAPVRVHVVGFTLGATGPRAEP